MPAGATRHRDEQRSTPSRSALPRPAAGAPAVGGAGRVRGRVRPSGAGSVSQLLHSLRGLEGHGRDPPAGQVFRQGPLLQRRHPGHGQHNPGGPDHGAPDLKREAGRPARAVPGRRISRHRDRQPDYDRDAQQGPVPRGRRDAHLAVRRRRTDRAVAARPVALSTGLRAQGRTHQGSRESHRGLQAYHPDRGQHQGRRIRPARDRGYGKAQ